MRAPDLPGWGLDEQNSSLNDSNLAASFSQGETGFPGLPGCKGSPGFDVSHFLYPLYFGIMGSWKFGSNPCYSDSTQWPSYM